MQMMLYFKHLSEFKRMGFLKTNQTDFIGFIVFFGMISRFVVGF